MLHTLNSMIYQLYLNKTEKHFKIELSELNSNYSLIKIVCLNKFDFNKDVGIYSLKNYC